MATKIFVNLLVKDLAKSVEFFSRLGYGFNPQFTDDNAACLVISDTIFAMLIIPSFFKTFTPKEISDAHTSTEVLLALSVDSRDEVDEMMAKAIAAGAKESREPQDHGFMYSCSFEDLDGHIWEVFWMDEEYVPPTQTKEE